MNPGGVRADLVHASSTGGEAPVEITYAEAFAVQPWRAPRGRAEFGHKGTTDNTLIGPTSTPFAIGKNAGGSSGGSPAAVADGLAAVAQASDADGSIRIPAAWRGVYGYKATFGVVPRAARPNAFKHAPLASSGVVARTVGDAALLL